MSLISVSAKVDAAGINLDAIDVGLHEAFIKAIGNVAHGAQNEWIRLAQNRLVSARVDYINGLRQAESFTTKVVGNLTTFELKLVGRMPNNFEFGMPSFDMKSVRPGWLGGKRSKEGKDGSRYVIIPFRHSLTSAAAIQYTGKAKRADLRTHLKATVREFGLDKMVRAATGQVVPGPVKRVPNKPDVHPYLRGLTRYQTPTAGRTPSGLQKGSSQMFTFRVMSENSDPASWIHPGIRAANLMKEVEVWIDSELDNIIDTMLVR